MLQNYVYSLDINTSTHSTERSGCGCKSSWVKTSHWNHARLYLLIGCRGVKDSTRLLTASIVNGGGVNLNDVGIIGFGNH